VVGVASSLSISKRATGSCREAWKRHSWLQLTRLSTIYQSHLREPVPTPCPLKIAACLPSIQIQQRIAAESCHHHAYPPRQGYAISSKRASVYLPLDASNTFQNMFLGFAGIVTAVSLWSIWGGDMFPADKDPKGGTLK
jgi:hypothetical protein